MYQGKFVRGRNPLLELCPFCGEAAEIYLVKKKGFKVVCSNDECPFRPKSRVFAESQELAIKLWNTRKGGAPEV